MPGVATGQSTHSKITALDNAVSGYRLLSVTRAGWIEPAVLTEERAQTGLVAGYQEDKKGAHQVSCPVSGKL